MRSLIIIVFLFAPLFVSSAQKSGKKILISGVVVDANREPVQGAMILIDNRKTDVMTNENGFYKIKIKPGSKIITVVTLLNGMDESSVEGKSVINFRLASSLQSDTEADKSHKNEEFIDIGYGKVKKSELTVPVGKIDGHNKNFAAYSDIYELIKGEVPGVQVSGKKIIIQGVSSLHLSSDPLLVVDGIAVTSIDDIRPIHVKSIQILKGAAASVYGSRGTNGVILITQVGAEKKK